ncbi:cytochrome c maturation protein CcmE [Pelagibacteraceae bacterium]|nr:cytochrome c maturation protein CcmE [Pelagibacteraceae bacterium]
MLTKKVKNRIFFLSLFILTSITLTFFILKTLNSNMLYFKTPSDIVMDEEIKIGKLFRLGGMVKKDSIISTNDEIKFIVTDQVNEIIVSFNGSVPNLFAEGKGVVAEGKLNDKKFFIAKRILAKHDENYMPPNLKNSLNIKNVK